MSPFARPLHAVVRAYQRLTAGRPSPCRFDPSCSSYALEALEHHGAAQGTWLTLRRLVRFNTWCCMGWDPVPDLKAYLCSTDCSM